jgi:hypothetical protein
MSKQKRKPPMVAELDAFGEAIAVAEKHRATLKRRFGLTDRQIGSMILARRRHQHDQI